MLTIHRLIYIAGALFMGVLAWDYAQGGRTLWAAAALGGAAIWMLALYSEGRNHD